LNNKGQFSIIAALFVAVILIATVIITFSTIRNSTVQDQPPLLSAVDETNLAVKQILGFTVGYYGSVLQVTGNYSYAKDLALKYLASGLVNIANMHPQWGTSLNVTESDLQTYWFTNASYSTGSLLVEYDLAGLGIQGLTYETSCRLDVNIVDSRDNQAFLSITKDENEPLINLGKQNFKFYCYDATQSKWTQISPGDEPVAYANGTYQIDIPSGVDPYSYLIQTEDTRGIMVVTSSFSQYTITPSWNSTSADGDNFVDSNISDVDSSPDLGSHSNFSAQQGFDNYFDVLTEARVDFLAKKGTFTKFTTTGSQIITGVGFRPKAMIFSWSRQTSYDEANGISSGYGFAASYGGSYGNGAASFASDDGALTSNTGRRRSSTYCIVILSDGDPTRSAQARVTSFSSDGFTLDWQTNEARADIIHYIALGGDGLTDARVDSFSLSTSGGSQDVTGIGFQPSFAMFLWTFSESPGNAANAEIGLGFATSSSQRAAIAVASEDGRGTMDTWEQQRTDSCILLLDPTDGSQDAVVDFNQFLADGFRLSKSDPPGSSTSILYLALKGGYYRVGSFNSPISTGNQDVTGVGFEPKLLMLTTQGRQASTSINSTAEIAFGTASSPADRGSTWFEDPDGLPDSDNEREILNTKVVQWRDRTSPNVFSLRGSADLASFLSDGFRLSWSTVESTAREVIYVAFGGSTDYQLDLEAQWLNTNFNGTTEILSIYANVGLGENLKVDVWYGGSWQNVIPALTSGWNNVSVASYLDSSTFTIRFKGSVETADLVQDSWQIDATLLHVLPVQDLYEYLGNATVVTEVLQDGTIRWLGEGLQMATAAKPIPPIPVRALRVNQTVNGVSTEVPFQVEDWASEYRIPLGLTNNASVFSGRNMLVFLMTPRVTSVTIWWSGSDRANQTSQAFTNRYFTGDDPDSGTLTNGKLTLQFGSGFTVTSRVGTVTSTANFMRINSENSIYGADPAYVIHHGIIRDIVHQEAEWGGGANNCPNLYAHIVLTLPANVTYYTYQLRLMFVQSQQSRSIADLCPIRLTTSIGTPETENGTSDGFPVLSTASSTFYNYSTLTSMHHWSQMISGGSGGGLFFRDEANEKLYVFDSIAGSKTGAITVNGASRTIELLPVTRFPVQFTSALDVSWCGAVATFDSSCLPIYGSIGGSVTGLWIIAEYPPAVTVTMTN
jgi:hypothetical protein